MKYNKIILIMLIAGLLINVSAYAGDEKTESKSDGNKPATAIEWLSYDDGLVKAKKEGKHLFIDFTAKWCGWCKKMDKTTFVEPEIVKMLNNDFVAVKVWGDSNNELDIEGYKITEKNLTSKDYKVRGYPTFWFLDPAGTKLGAVSGYQHATNLMSYLEYVKNKNYEEKSPADESGDNDNKDEKK